MTGQGTILMQASAVAIEGRAVVIKGPPGSGKSTLAMALIDRGAELVGDDGMRLTRQEGAVIAHPPPHTAGKLEIRGVGIAHLPATSAKVSLIVSLDDAGERLPDVVPMQTLEGCKVPYLGLAESDPASLPLRVEWALRIHGLPANGVSDWA